MQLLAWESREVTYAGTCVFRLSCWVAGVVLAGYSPVSDTGSLTVKSWHRHTKLWTEGNVEVSIIATWSFKENRSSAPMVSHLPCSRHLKSWQLCRYQLPYKQGKLVFSSSNTHFSPSHCLKHYSGLLGNDNTQTLPSTVYTYYHTDLPSCYGYILIS